MSGDDKTANSPFSEELTGGRLFLAGLFIVAVTMLAIIGWQTTPGETGQTAMAGGWWAEPALAPAVALVITIISAGLAYFAARRETLNLSVTLQTYGQILLIAGCMVGAILLMKIFGFAISILLFATVAAVVGGFRGRKLAAIAFGTMVTMVLVFRIGFKIWFPRPSLFKWVELPIWLQEIL